MADRPFVLLSVATSVDGYIDDTSPQRLLLSNAEDFDRVDQVRAESDAILIGGNTLRRDNPRLP
ncbi:RibD family protein [Kitasatospora kifunensis]|uniref:Riboflavin biosynthesis pyrimidine reductase n=1 Tax=Kitasatospora kifunensis TaxID=58351 RepID=A0A7W7VTL1_KITKI|nr:dihydrofolate reductase family protein [Kitasatospora kifunensis]MBB4921540.1 riboflavin biosynthesis pyrimidine reductase [Kitasatospora kifunensis]